MDGSADPFLFVSTPRRGVPTTDEISAASLRVKDGSGLKSASSFTADATMLAILVPD
jgi:hypothetical protein